MTNKKNTITFCVVVFAVILLNVVSQFWFFRLDLTSEGRYSLSNNSRNLLRELDSDIKVIIYLDGDLNSGFLRLRRASVEMLSEFRAHAGRRITFSFVNPSAAATEQERMEKHQNLERMGLSPIQVFERDAEGRNIQKIIFPWAQFIKGNDTVNVNLLQNIRGRSGSENLNTSIEKLEFVMTDAIRRLAQTTRDKIAFIEGHDNPHEILTEDITLALLDYFEVERGILSNDPRILDDFKALIVAQPKQRFTEVEKFIIDQFIMNGGRVLWLVDGARVSLDTLANMGMSPAIQNDVNLSDQLFRYGVRINPNLLIDAHCTYILLDKSLDVEQPNFQLAPWYFAPLLLPSPNHAITRNLVEVRSEFVSSIDLVGNDPNITQTVLLTTSQHSRIIPTPARVGFEITAMPRDPAFFPHQNVITGVLLEGKFTSIFANRFPPQGVLRTIEQRELSVPTRMIVVSDGDVILNEVRGVGANARVMPLGFDSNMNMQFGNRDFILNSMLYLTDDEGWLELRAREFQLRLLDRVMITTHKTKLQVLNVLLPVVLLMLFAVANFYLRKRKYAK